MMLIFRRSAVPRQPLVSNGPCAMAIRPVRPRNRRAIPFARNVPKPLDTGLIDEAAQRPSEPLT